MRSKKAIKNIISSLMQQIITIVCGLILPRVIIGNYGSNVNGLISSITQFLYYISLLEAGIGPVIKSVLYKPIADKDKNTIEKILKASQKFFNVIAYIFIGYLIVLSFIYPYFVKDEFSTWYTVSLLIIISISTFAEYFFGMVYKLYLQAEQKTYITANIQSITTILNTICSVFLIKFGASIQIVKLISSFIFVFRPILQNIYVKKHYNIKLNEVKDDYKLKQKWDGLAQHIAAVIHGNTDVTLLTIFSTTAEISVYTVYYYIINGIKNVVQAFTGGIDASFGDMYVRNEKEHLRESYKVYELFYYTIITIVFSCTIVMIVPFIQVYTLGITDVNYYRPVFAYLLVLAEYAWAIRLPYSSITLAVGHFKQTQKGAWVEALSNIIISIILVGKYGIIGVTIGTLFAMTIRTIEFVYHTSKYILERNQIYSYIHIFITAVQTIIIFVISNKIMQNVIFNSYLIWIKYAIIIMIISCFIILFSNLLLYKNESRELMKTIRKNIERK